MSFNKLADGIALTDDEIRRLAEQEIDQSDIDADGLEENLIGAYDAYHGVLKDEADRKAKDRSIQRATDVSDAVEWILPHAIKAIVESPEAVRFEPLSPEDEDQADIEADYVHHYFFNKCQGYTTLYSSVKDALLCKNCITATYHQDRKRSWIEPYKDLTEVELADLLESDDASEITVEESEEREVPVRDPMTGQILPDPEAMQSALQQYQQTAAMAQQRGIGPQQMPPPPNPADIAEQFPQMQTLYDVKIRRRESRGETISTPIPVDHFYLRKGWKSALVDNNTPFCAYETEQTAADLIEMGYETEVVDNLSFQESVDSEVEEARKTEEGDDPDTSLLSRSQRVTTVYRCYMVLDVNGDGYNERIWVTLAGEEEKTLLGWEEVPENPFSTGAVILEPHKFLGVSIYDKLRYIQAQKTKFLQMLDENLDQQNDPPKTVLEGAANLDDLLDGRGTGRYFRIREDGAVQPYPVPMIGQSATALLDYYDKMRTERVGADPGMQSISSVFPEESMNSAVERLMAAKEEMVALMVRTIAETWLKDQFLKVRGVLMRNMNHQVLVKLRNKWQEINPANWVERTSTMVKIGLGTGDRLEMRSGMKEILALQQTIKQTGGPVPYSRIYQATADLTRSFGREPSDYFVDPKELKDQNSPIAQEVSTENRAAKQAAEEAKQNDPATKMAEATIAVERLKAQVKQMEAQTKKAQGDQDLMAEMKRHMDEMRQENQDRMSEMQRHYDDLEFKYNELATKTGTEERKIAKSKTIPGGESGSD